MTKNLKDLLEAKKKEYLKRIDALNPKYFVDEGVKTDELGFQHDIKTQWDWIESEIVSAFSLGQQSTLQEVEEAVLQDGWHETDCPAHSNQMQKESECNCLYSFIRTALSALKIKDK